MQLNPAAGVQTYVPPPVALSVVFDPVQIEISVPAFTIGCGFTVTVTEAVFVPQGAVMVKV